LDIHGNSPTGAYGKGKHSWFKKVRNASPKIFEHSILTQKQIESKCYNIALAASEA